jgi:hypothetical protein
LCEAAYTIVKGWLEGENYPRRLRSRNRSHRPAGKWRRKYQQVLNSRSARVLIPRMMIGLYDIRNDRGVGHAGAEVDPN